MEAIKALIAKHNHPEMAKDPITYQVWEDGEITLQKGGDLLWQRKLHLMLYGAPEKAVPVELFPRQQSNGHGYLHTSKEGAKEISAAIRGRVL